MLDSPVSPRIQTCSHMEKSIPARRHEEPYYYFMNTREGFLDSDNYYDDVTWWICH